MVYAFIKNMGQKDLGLHEPYPDFLLEAVRDGM